MLPPGGRSAATPAHSENQENFRPSGPLPIIGAGAKGETGGVPFFFLFLSAFGFFFSRLLLNWPFAMVCSLLSGGER
jgi:hypothetical protein